ncbi:hypothetical protein ARMGADRAFT_299287 [Armillaria gallica]|uniref:Uncharacterized protein n=1 Tax=Armillaria gallica TaxID=47427 RepID=A0A2H3D8T3_ARMGA|nr:hypothetical protein ARMGADRAFT_299287 [Armillaria gallica]
MDFSWAALYANLAMTSIPLDPAIRRSQAQSRLRSYDAIPRASFLPGLIYSRYPYATCWIARKNRAVKKIPSLWRRLGESFVEVFFQLVSTRLSSSQDTVPGEHTCPRFCMSPSSLCELGKVTRDHLNLSGDPLVIFSDLHLNGS